MDHPGRDAQILDPRQTRLQVPQARDQLGQGQDPVVVAQLQEADARGQLQDAGGNRPSPRASIRAWTRKRSRMSRTWGPYSTSRYLSPLGR